jgi:hypothetical protein
MNTEVKNNIVTPNINNKDIFQESMELSRWIALYEAVNLIADAAEDKNIPFEKVEIKPLDVRDYIDKVEDIINRDVLKEIYGINVCKLKEDNLETEIYKY